MSGGILPTFVTPGDVRDLKTRIDPFVRAMDRDVQNCKAASEDFKSGWAAFSGAWRSYFDQEDSWLHTAAQMNQGEAYEQDLAHWQASLRGQRCQATAPTIEPSSNSPSLTSLPSLGRGELGSTLRTVAIAGAVIAVGLGIREVMK
jgi:hypothetical protein